MPAVNSRPTLAERLAAIEARGAPAVAFSDAATGRALTAPPELAAAPELGGAPAATAPAPARRRVPTAPARPLRAWQVSALSAYRSRGPRDFLAVATPGAGKTTFALQVAADLLAAGTVRAVTVVAPTEHLKTQWAEAAAKVGIALDPAFRNSQGTASGDFQGVAVTYAQVAAHPLLHRARTDARRTLVVLDEVHHAGDALSWGDAVKEAFEPAARRLMLTGTPFRSDANPIPFVSYVQHPDGSMRSASDHAYGYADALRDGVVRPVLFLAYSGETRWRTSAGDEVSATLGDPLTPDVIAQAWRTALDPAGDWIREVLGAADTRLTQVREGGMPDAGGMVIASDHTSARAYAGLLRELTGSQPTVVLSDDPSASSKIAAFDVSTDRWLVAVRMVSEGVDIPRLAVGVYATSTSTPLFFAQAVGRFVRSRRPGETASVFLPSVPTLLGLAAEMEAQRDHVLGGPTKDGDGLDDHLLEQANRTDRTADGQEESLFQALGATATFDRLVHDGTEVGFAVTEEDQEFLGLPGLLEPQHVAELLRRRRAAEAAPTAAGGAAPVAPQRSAHQVLAGLRKELNGLVAARNIATGIPHGAIHAELRRVCGGPPTAQATAQQLEERIATIRGWRSATPR